MTQLTHIAPADLGETDRTLKSKHRAMWASGSYPSVVTDLVGPRADIGRCGGNQTGRRSTRCRGREAAMPRFPQPRTAHRSLRPTSHPNFWRWARNGLRKLACS